MQGPWQTPMKRPQRSWELHSSMPWMGRRMTTRWVHGPAYVCRPAFVRLERAPQRGWDIHQVFSPAGARPSHPATAAHEPQTAPAPATVDARHLPRASVRSRASPAGPQLDGLPAEVLLKVLSFLSASDLVNCCTVSRALAVVTVSRSPGADQLWRRLFRARYALSTALLHGICWPLMKLRCAEQELLDLQMGPEHGDARTISQASIF